MKETLHRVSLSSLWPVSFRKYSAHYEYVQICLNYKKKPPFNCSN